MRPKFDNPIDDPDTPIAGQGSIDLIIQQISQAEHNPTDMPKLDYAGLKFAFRDLDDFFRTHLKQFCLAADVALEKYIKEHGDEYTTIEINVEIPVICSQCQGGKLILVRADAIMDRSVQNRHEREESAGRIVRRGPDPGPRQIGSTYEVGCPKCKRGFRYRRQPSFVFNASTKK